MQDKINSSQFFQPSKSISNPGKAVPLIIWGDNHSTPTNISLLTMQLDYLFELGYKNISFEFDEDLTLEDNLIRCQTIVNKLNEPKNGASLNSPITDIGQFFKDFNIISSRLAFYQKIKELKYQYQGIDLNLLEYRNSNFTPQDIIVNGKKKYPAPGFTKELYSDRNINMLEYISNIYSKGEGGEIAFVGLRHLIGLENVGLADLLAEKLGKDTFNNNVIFIHVVEPTKAIFDSVHAANSHLSKRLSDKGYKFNSYILDKGTDFQDQFRKIIDLYLSPDKESQQIDGARNNGF